MNSFRRLLPAWFRCVSFGTVLLAGAGVARAQAPTGRNIVSVSPLELFYKAQLGYERQIGGRSSLGGLFFYRYGSDQLGITQRYQGWHATAQYRYFLTRPFPTGLYLQVQASAFNHRQEANLININTYQPYSFEYEAVSGGGGFGWGYRGYLLRRAFGQHLLGNVLVGARLQNFPHAEYDAVVYRPKMGFLGNTDEANWYMSNSPGSFVFGLLTLDYQF